MCPFLHSLLDTQHLPRKPIRQCWTTGSKLCKYPSTDTGGPLSSFLYVVQLVLFIRCICNLSFRTTGCLPQPLFGPLSSQPPLQSWSFSHLSMCSQNHGNQCLQFLLLVLREQKRRASGPEPLWLWQARFPSASWCVSSARSLFYLQGDSRPLRNLEYKLGLPATSGSMPGMGEPATLLYS